MPRAKVLKLAGLILLLLVMPSSVTFADAKRRNEEEGEFGACDEELDSDECNDDKEEIFTLGEPTIGGSGCPMGSVQTVISDDGQELSVFFEEFVAETSMVEGKYKEYKSCNVGIPVSILPGWSIGIFKVDYRGFCIVPSLRRSMALFSAEYFFAGTRGAKSYRRWTPGKGGPFTITDMVGAVAMSACGGTEILRVNTWIYVRRGSGGDETDDVYMHVDTGDVTIPVSLNIPLDELCFVFGIQALPCDDDEGSDEDWYPSYPFGQSRTVPKTYNLRHGGP